LVMIKDYNKGETNWNDAFVVIWQTPSQGFCDAQELADCLKNNICVEPDEERGIIGACHRSVYQCCNEYFIVVSWFTKHTGSYVLESYERAIPILKSEGFEMEVIKSTSGRHYKSDCDLLADCVRIIDTIDGDLTPVGELRKVIGEMQSTQGLRIADEIQKNEQRAA